MDRIDERLEWLVLPNAEVDAEARRQDLDEECRLAVEKWRARKEKRRRIFGNAVIVLVFAIWMVALTVGILDLLGKI